MLMLYDAPLQVASAQPLKSLRSSLQPEDQDFLSLGWRIFWEAMQNEKSSPVLCCNQ